MKKNWPKLLSDSQVDCCRSCEAMGTRFEVMLCGADEQHLEAVAVAVCEEIVRLDSVLSRFNPAGEIARVNRAAKSKAVRIDRELFALLERCEQARDLTEGFFDITATTGGNGLALNSENSTVQFTRPDTVIDLGAIGKGYALDRSFEILARFGIEQAMLNGGTSSVRASGEAWAIDVRHPLLPERIVQRIELTNRALSCSAARHPTQTQSDVVNPLTGQPIVGDDACLVIAASATEAEIFSTALLAMGNLKAECFLNKLASQELQVSWF